MIVTTTAIDGQPVTTYVGVVTGEAVLGANDFRDRFAGLSTFYRLREVLEASTRDSNIREGGRGRADGCRRGYGRGRRLRVDPGGAGGSMLMVTPVVRPSSSSGILAADARLLTLLQPGW